mgnify:FL=1
MENYNGLEITPEGKIRSYNMAQGFVIKEPVTYWFEMFRQTFLQDLRDGTKYLLPRYEAEMKAYGDRFSNEIKAALKKISDGLESWKIDPSDVMQYKGDFVSNVNADPTSTRFYMPAQLEKIMKNGFGEEAFRMYNFALKTSSVGNALKWVFTQLLTPDSDFYKENNISDFTRSIYKNDIIEACKCLRFWVQMGFSNPVTLSPQALVFLVDFAGKGTGDTWQDFFGGLYDGKEGINEERLNKHYADYQIARAIYYSTVSLPIITDWNSEGVQIPSYTKTWFTPFQITSDKRLIPSLWRQKWTEFKWAEDNMKCPFVYIPDMYQDFTDEKLRLRCNGNGSNALINTEFKVQIVTVGGRKWFRELHTYQYLIFVLQLAIDTCLPEPYDLASPYIGQPHGGVATKNVGGVMAQEWWMPLMDSQSTVKNQIMPNMSLLIPLEKKMTVGQKISNYAAVAIGGFLSIVSAGLLTPLVSPLLKYASESFTADKNRDLVASYFGKQAEDVGNKVEQDLKDKAEAEEKKKTIKWGLIVVLIIIGAFFIFKKLKK